MKFLGTFKVGDTIRYSVNFHDDANTTADPGSPAARHRKPDNTYADLAAPAKLDAKTGWYGGSIDTTGFAVGSHEVRISGTVDAHEVATVISFELESHDLDDIYGLPKLLVNPSSYYLNFGHLDGVDENGFLEWHINTIHPVTGQEFDADELPTFRIYGKGISVAITGGSLVKLDDVNTTGYYAGRVAITTASGFEVGKYYFIRTRAVVNGIAQCTSHTFLVTSYPWETIADIEDIKNKTDDLNFDGNNVLAEVADKGVLNNPPSENIADYKADVSALATQVNMDAGFAALNDPSAATIADAIWDELLAGHQGLTTFGGAVRTMLALQKQNIVWDNTAFDAQGDVTSMRVRLFDTSVAALAATDGGSGEGEFLALSVTGAYTGGKLDIGKAVEA